MNGYYVLKKEVVYSSSKSTQQSKYIQIHCKYTVNFCILGSPSHNYVWLIHTYNILTHHVLVHVHRHIQTRLHMHTP